MSEPRKPRERHGQEPRALPPRELLSQLRKELLAWYDAHKRDLPWRRTGDPYAIWVSETMLQQTRVDTVIPYYERFLERFPTVQDLANAETEAVYEAWTGLGYYSRARNLQAAARSIVADHAGELPRSAAALRELKGIGRYTAGAVASIAFDHCEPLVDGNVMRVFARLFGLREQIARPEVVEHAWRIAAALVEGSRPGDLNQALMELGAIVCTPKSPLCLSCTLRPRCDAAQAGDADTLPIKAKKARARKVRAAAAWIERRGRILAVRRPESGLLGGMWELPSAELTRGARVEDALPAALAAHLGLECEANEQLGEIEHLFTHRRLRLAIYRVTARAGRVRRGEAYAEHRWLSPDALAHLPHGGPTRKVLALLGFTDQTTHRERARRGHDRGSS